MLSNLSAITAPGLDALREIGRAIRALAEWLTNAGNCNTRGILKAVFPDVKPSKKLFQFMASVIGAGIGKRGRYVASANELVNSSYKL